MPEIQELGVEIPGLGIIRYTHLHRIGHCGNYNAETNTTPIYVYIELYTPLEEHFRYLHFTRNTHSSALEHEELLSRTFKNHANKGGYEQGRKITVIAIELYGLYGNVTANRWASADEENSNIGFCFSVKGKTGDPAEYLESLAKQMAEWIEKDKPTIEE